jgi:beta-galactosidase
LVTPDRLPHPGLYEVKKVYQDILFTRRSPKGDNPLRNFTVTIENRFMYNDLKDYAFKWELVCDGKKIYDGTFDVKQPAGTKKDVTLPLPEIDLNNGGKEYLLNLYAYTKTATDMLPDNHEIAREQFDYYTAMDIQPEATTEDAIQIAKDDENHLELQNTKQDITVVFNKKTGELERYACKGKNLLLSGPRPDFWRAPTDNDYGNQMPEKCAVWKEAGKSKTLKSFKVSNQKQSIIVTADYALNSVSADYQVIYILSSGGIQVNVSYKSDADLPEIPRFGMQMTLPAEFENIEYYGRGPLENYPDRNTASFLGIYKNTVSNFGYEYIRPQENGNRTDVRWLTLTDKDGFGLKIKGTQPLNVKAAHNTAEDLDFGITKKNTHPCDITPRKEVFLNVDLTQRGVGGDNSWGALPHKPYLLLNKTYQYGYEISVVK